MKTINKQLVMLSIVSASLLLGGCSIGVSHNEIKVIQPKKLADGKSVEMGYVPVDNAWECTQIGQTQYNWGMMKEKAQFKDWGNSFGYLEDSAIDYANQNKLEPDYVYMEVPDQVSVGAVTANPNAKVQVIYYTCKNPPASSNKIL